ncbi:GNAT superfamily N-acetyltransferase [Actinoplanes lutulentus]|uniref:Acetyltransferase (GNAT) family protein n=1 Tax=Actinoplanes lutulentus TaxID=1287878 RepID=A0A327ZEL6_9ACTN|nr:GNAT family N-acetyltransferase [Actinoplanes lutulentus]MBB2942841.1 GNAT superfamily N-acetyltransferase [Actinoplanes lutulentus]RAK38420.1 acetyltransferase (GNAT) family protein [Actinoplanes lutulentus]
MDISVVAASEATWSDLQKILGTRGEPARCQCQWFKITAAEWGSVPVPERSRRLRAQSAGGSGLVAYADGEPAGWCAVEPRTVYPRLSTARVPWTGRDENRLDAAVWAVTCFVTRTGYRRRGVSRALVASAVGFARERGARALEGYPMVVAAGREYSWGELYVGSRKIFEEAGFVEVSRPTPRRVVMRVEF